MASYPQSIERVSIATDGTQGNGASGKPSLSADGRYVAFESDAFNLVPADTNGVTDIFLYDRTLHALKRISASDAGIQANGISSDPVISSDGRYIAYASRASNLVTGDTNDGADVFLYDSYTQKVSRISTNSDWAIEGALSISADGHYVAFVPETGLRRLLLYTNDGHGGSLKQINPSPFAPYMVPTATSISADGKYVAYDGQLNPFRNDGIEIYLYNSVTGSTEQITTGEFDSGFNLHPSISADGNVIAFVRFASAGATPQIYVYDRTAKTTELASIATNGSLSDGLAYFNRHAPAISADGRYVTFSSDADNLVTLDQNHAADIFVYDRNTKSVALVSLSDTGVQSNGSTQYGTYNSYANFDPAINTDGQYIAFQSYANNLVPGDNNGTYDIFVVNRGAGVASHIDTFNTVSLKAKDLPLMMAEFASCAYLNYPFTATTQSPTSSGAQRVIFRHIGAKAFSA